jgi:hypothetical protein
VIEPLNKCFLRVCLDKYTIYYANLVHLKLYEPCTFNCTHTGVQLPFCGVKHNICVAGCEFSLGLNAVEDNIKMKYECAIGLPLPRNKIKLSAIVQTIFNLPVPSESLDIFMNCATESFSERTLL